MYSGKGTNLEYHLKGTVGDHSHVLARRTRLDLFYFHPGVNAHCWSLRPSCRCGLNFRQDERRGGEFQKTLSLQKVAKRNHFQGTDIRRRRFNSMYRVSVTEMDQKKNMNKGIRAPMSSTCLCVKYVQNVAVSKNFLIFFSLLFGL